MELVQDRFVSLNGLRFHYREWPNPAAPALLTLHGGWEAAANWDPVASALADKYHVFALDQRGHGETEWATDYRLARSIEDVREFVHKLKLTALSLVGFSHGGTIGFLYAAGQPKALRRLVVIDHGPDVVDVLRPQVEQIGKPVVPPPPTDPVLCLPDVMDLYPSAAAQWDLVPSILCPTLLIRAEKSDRFPRETAERMATTIPNCRLVEIPGSRHRILQDRPDDLIAAAREFLI